MTSDPSRLFWAALACLVWLVLIGLVYLREQRAKVRQAKAAAALVGDQGAESLIVAYASQTGFAEELAWMTARALTDTGLGVQIVSLADLDRDALRQTQKLLIIASTTGEGDAPDSAGRFVRQVMSQSLDLSHLSFGLMALGDRSYDHYCRFGHALADWLEGQGAKSLFDRIEVDNGQAQAIRRWQDHLSELTGMASEAGWTQADYQPWRLVERTHLNPGSPGGEAWHMVLEPVGQQADWQAGDIAEIRLPQPDQSPVITRDYSLASLSSEGRAEFCIRLMTTAEGGFGLGSGWLIRTAQIGEDIPMRIRTNRNFHAPPLQAPLILIGNGTGIAGLRSHIKARAETGATGTNWLIYGERTRAHDQFYADELQGWQTAGHLDRMDLCFSREGEDPKYVQGLISQHGRLLTQWVERGAYIYVCGSLNGMSQGVHAALETVLGEALLAQMSETGRYRRDVY